MKGVLKFLKDLRAHNNREWFNAHKRVYNLSQDICNMLAAQLIAAVAEVDSEASHLGVAGCTYRIYRDTRFSYDKTPYKTHIGIFINPPAGKKGLTCGYYFHIEPGNCMVIAGTVCHPPKVLRAIRQTIYDEVDVYRGIVESDEFRKYFKEVGMDMLKTAPKGFDKDWEYIEYLRPKNYCAVCNVPDDFFVGLSEGRMEEWDDVTEMIRQMHRFNSFLNFTIEDFM